MKKHQTLTLLLGLFISLSCHKTSDLHVDPPEGDYSSENSLVYEDPIPDQPLNDPFMILTGYPTAQLPNLSETEQAQVNQDIITNSLAYLKTNYGFTDAQFVQHFGSIDAPEVGYLGIILLALEQTPPITPGSGGCLGITDKTLACIIAAGIPCETIKIIRAKAAAGTPHSREDLLALFGGICDTTLSSYYGGPLVLFLDLSDCVTREETPVDPTDPGSPNPIIPGVGTVFFSYGDTYTRIEAIINGKTPTHTTKIYLKSGKYYYTEDLSCILPDGFYNGGGSQIYKVQGGALVGISTVTPCTTCPTPQLPPLNNPFVPCADAL